jgi:hypothetical protein
VGPGKAIVNGESAFSKEAMSSPAQSAWTDIVMTIPYVGRCLGSGELPREGTEETAGERTTGVGVTCSGRFEVEDGRIVAHETAPDDERESVGTVA